MGKAKRRVRDKTGPHKDSYRRQVEHKTIGRRMAKTGKCTKR
jgi:hypothetical protein